MNNQPKSKDETYLVDTSAIIHKKVSKLLKHNQIKGTILVPNAAIAELENLANRGQDIGFKGLEEIAKLHKFKYIL